MRPDKQSHRIARRRFVSEAGLAVGALSAGALAHAKAAISTPRFDYDIERFRKVDPALIRYERTLRFAVSKPDPRRLAIGPGGRLYVATGNSILILDQRGGLIRSIAASSPMRSLALASVPDCATRSPRLHRQARQHSVKAFNWTGPCRREP